ncbi:MAG: carbohydrate kinase family protein [Ruminococcus sp.]|nr:carbohydrate kinase family protein [Ruminococcus sp.]
MKILVSGLINTETTAKVQGFPINYYPIDYSFFGVGTSVSGVAFNLAKALTVLGDEVRLCSLTGDDIMSNIIFDKLRKNRISGEKIFKTLSETPQSVVLYDEKGRRQIYCDLKDIQEKEYCFSPEDIEDVDAVMACNINFNRPLLKLCKEQNKLIATDVHILSNPDDEYNRDFLEAADILFLSDEGIKEDYRSFILSLAARYSAKIIVLGMGAEGALMYLREDNRFVQQPACNIGGVVNTVGAGDALFSSFVHFCVKGLSAEDALKKAQRFAALKIQHSGAANGFVSEEELGE